MDAAEVSLRGLEPRTFSTRRALTISRERATGLALLLALAVGFGLRWPVLVVNPFHEDEALYSTWALRIAEGTDPWLDGVMVDKPPLFPYLLGGLFRLLGPSEVVARLPGLAAGLGSILCLYGLARRLYGREAGLLAAWSLALSPFHISLSGTAFTDPLMVFWGLASLWAAAGQRWLLAGGCLGLAASTKQHGLFFIPLVLLLSLLWWAEPVAVACRPAVRGSRPPRLLPLLPAAGLMGMGVVAPGRVRGSGWKGRVSKVASLVAGFALPMGLTTWWDAHRWAFRPSYFDRSLTAYGGIRLARLEELPERLRDWAALAGYLGVSPWVNGLLVAAAGALAFHATWVLLKGKGSSGFRAALTDLLWLAFGGCYLLGHWASNFQAWDRYLLPLAPLASLVLARGFILAGERLHRLPTFPRRVGAGALIALGVLLAFAFWQPAAQASASRLPLGADHGAYDGMAVVAEWLRVNVGEDQPVYHRWLGWHLGYYLHGSAVEPRWYPDADELVRVVGQREGGYLVAPTWHSLHAERVALARAGYRLEMLIRARGREETCAVTVYRVAPGAPPRLERMGGVPW